MGLIALAYFALGVGVCAAVFVVLLVVAATRLNARHADPDDERDVEAPQQEPGDTDTHLFI